VGGEGGSGEKGKKKIFGSRPRIREPNKAEERGGVEDPLVNVGVGRARRKGRGGLKIKKKKEKHRNIPRKKVKGTKGKLIMQRGEKRTRKGEPNEIGGESIRGKSGADQTLEKKTLKKDRWKGNLQKTLCPPHQGAEAKRKLL